MSGAWKQKAVKHELVRVEGRIKRVENYLKLQRHRLATPQADSLQNASPQNLIQVFEQDLALNRARRDRILEEIRMWADPPSSQ